MLPLTYILAKSFGIIGPAIGSLVSITVYNFIRTIFLWKKFRLFPLTIHSLQTVLLAASCYGACYFAFREWHGLAGMFTRSLAFILLYAAGTVYLKLTPDIKPVMQSIKKRLGITGR
jgi:O-antigen/teichoic acid export membrane protein